MSDQLSPTPPSPPRHIPKEYRKALVAGDPFYLIGAILGGIGALFFTVGVVFVAVGVGVIFIPLGGALLLGGGLLLFPRIAKFRKMYAAYEHGQTARGQVTELTYQYNVSINGQHPYIIKYNFRAEGRELADSITMHHPSAAYAKQGDEIFVFYTPGQPEINVPFPNWGDG